MQKKQLTSFSRLNGILYNRDKHMNNENKKKLVAIYIRVSTLDQAREGYSLDAQERTLRKWCTEHNADVYQLYADRGLSGKDIEHRPAMQELLQDAKEQRYDAIIFWALSRFTRSVSDLYDILSLLQKHNIDMISYTESFDTSSPMGRAMIGIVGIFAQLERELTAERVSAAMAERALQGKRTCSDVLGYNIDVKDTFTINPKEAEYVEYAFFAYLKYKNLSQVAYECRIRGYRGKRGKIPTAYSIQVILTRPIYCGYNMFKGNIYKGNHQAIIPISIYNKVQSMLRRMGKLYGRHAKEIPQNLSEN